jgi:hypothetical protein
LKKLLQMDLNKTEVGYIFLITSGAIALIYGLYHYSALLITFSLKGDLPGFLTSGNNIFSFNKKILQRNEAYWSLYYSFSHIGWTNVIGGSVAIIYFSYINMKNYQKWIWILLFSHTFVTSLIELAAVTMSMKMLYLYILKVPLAYAGLFLTRPQGPKTITE